jgi:hypothetical protein
MGMTTQDSRIAGTAPAPQGRHCAEHVIEIAASAQAVRAALFDFGGWSAWNPLYPEAGGTLAPGETLRFAVLLEGMKPNRSTATVLAADPAAGTIRYEVRAMGGLARATRYIAVDEVAPGRVRVVNGEAMGGLLGPLLFRAVGEKVRRGLEGMNRALQARLETARRDADAQGEETA